MTRTIRTLAVLAAFALLISTWACTSAEAEPSAQPERAAQATPPADSAAQAPPAEAEVAEAETPDEPADEPAAEPAVASLDAKPVRPETPYDKLIDDLIPGMAAENVVDRQMPQATLERLCFDLSAPDANAAQRRQLGGALAARLGPETPRDARIWIIRQLERMGQDECVAALETLLADDDSLLSDPARRALQKNPSPTATQALLRGLSQTTDSSRKVGLINALAERHDEHALPALIALIADGDKDVSAAAIAGAAQFADQHSIATLRSIWRGDDEAQRNQATAGLLRVAETLRRTGRGAEAASIYLDLFNSSIAAPLRVAALAGMAHTDRNMAMRFLPQILRGELEPFMQLDAARLLGEMPGDATTQLLADAAPELPALIQVAVLDVLSQRGGQIAREAAYKALLNEDESVRIAALHALTALGDQNDLEALATIAAGTEGAEREAARHALARLRGGDNLTGEISRLLGKPINPYVRIELIHAVAARHQKDFVPRLLALHRQWGPREREADYETLAKLSEPNRVPTLLSFLVSETEDAATRQAAEDAVVTLVQRDNTPEAQVRLISSVYEATKGPGRIGLVHVLGRLQGADALKVMRSAMADEDPDVADAAVRALAEWRTPEVLTELATLAEHAKSPAQRVLALRGYIRLLRIPSQRPPGETLARLKAIMPLVQSDNERRLILAALGDVPHEDALAWGREFLTGGTLRDEAGVAMANIALALAGSQPDVSTQALKELEATGLSDAARKRIAEVRELIDKFQGFIATWEFAGPYSEPADGYDAVFEYAYAPETDQAGQVNWLPLRSATPGAPYVFDLNGVADCGNCAIYARAAIWSETARPARLEIGSDDGVQVWLNGERVHSHAGVRGHSLGTDKVDVQLNTGWNTVMLKVAQAAGGWEFSCGVRSRNDAPLKGLRFAAEAPE